jgi:hypothetical protein
VVNSFKPARGAIDVPTAEVRRGLLLSFDHSLPQGGSKFSGPYLGGRRIVPGFAVLLANAPPGPACRPAVADAGEAGESGGPLRQR